MKPLRPSKTKEDIIVSLGRISPEKNQLEQLLIAKVMREKGMKFDLFIMGSLDKSSRKCMQYYELLMRKMSAWNLKGRVEILANVSRRDMEEIVGRAKVMLHTYKFHLKDLGTIGEHFGIAVAECMSAGAIPIVPAVPSGVWWDILERGRYGYGYHSIAECASKIGMIIKSWSDHELLSRECIRRAGMYSFERFRKEIVKVVRKVSEEAKYISEPQRFSMSVSIGV
ncbi:MAG: hypothetical protein DRM97_06640 [Thermoprotei archaeon]|nr:MAG: hypothetical protein DRM97_06640 [Thermoprotei archaeon]